MATKAMKFLFLDTFFDDIDFYTLRELYILDEIALISLLERRNRNSVCNYSETVVPRYTISEFRSHFRMSPSCFEDFLRIIMSHSPLTPEMERGRECIPSEKQLLLSLWYMATPECIRSIGDRFDVTKSSVHRTLRRFFDAMTSIRDIFIIWPTGVRVLENTEKFKRMAGFPGVIGAIDGTHINIPKPVEHSAAYLNRKKAYSLILQAVCDPTLAFVDIYIGWPGSVHDARVFSNSPLKDKLTQILSDEFHLLGDGAYPLSRALLTPFRDFGTLTISEKSYNIKHAKTRNAIERAFGILKGKWRRLRHVEMTNVEDVVKCILSACVLHNFALASDDEDQSINVDDVDNDGDNDGSNDVDGPAGPTTSVALQKRDLIKNML